jgi:hypothetical protein
MVLVSRMVLGGLAPSSVTANVTGSLPKRRNSFVPSRRRQAARRASGSCVARLMGV